MFFSIATLPPGNIRGSGPGLERLEGRLMKSSKEARELAHKEAGGVALRGATWKKYLGNVI